MSYADFIERKHRTASFGGIAPRDTAAHLYPFQRDLVEWALTKGRSAIFADTGLGKTPMQLEWARQVSREGRVLILAPLAVAEQTVEQGIGWGVDIAYAREDTGARVTITNYEMLDHFDPRAFVGVVLDESSILKSYDGRTRTELINAFAATPYRLCCTATPAPNDFTELGNHAEFLGVLSRTEMLSEYFIHDGGSTKDWRIKGHAVDAFWRWVASWGLVVKRPSDLGYDDGRFNLPPLHLVDERIEVDHSDFHGEGFLFAPDARTLNEQRAVRKSTLDRRIAIAARLAEEHTGSLIIWCEYNRESAGVASAIPGAVEVQGSDSPEVKAERLLGFARGRYRVLVTKPSIAGFGMNWQHCNRMIFMGPSHSYEQTYQAIRRCWRFGQRSEVTAHTICADNEMAVVTNYAAKEARANVLSTEMVNYLRPAMLAELGIATGRTWNEYDAHEQMKTPAWLQRRTVW